MLMIGGEYDLSIGSTLAFCGMIFGAMAAAAFVKPFARTAWPEVAAMTASSLPSSPSAVELAHRRAEPQRHARQRRTQAVVPGGDGRQTEPVIHRRGQVFRSLRVGGGIAADLVGRPDHGAPPHARAGEGGERQRQGHDQGVCRGEDRLAPYEKRADENGRSHHHTPYVQPAEHPESTPHRVLLWV